MCEIFTLNSRETHSREINVNKFTWNSLNAKFTWNSRVFHVKLNVKFTWSSFHVNFTWGTIGCVAHREEVRGSLCYTLGVGVRTWLKFLLQFLYLSYYLSYLHQTCMDDASGPTYGLKRLGCWIWVLNFRCWRRLRFLEQVKVFVAGALW